VQTFTTHAILPIVDAAEKASRFRTVSPLNPAGEISRDDVAEMCIDALCNPDAWNKTVEVVSDSDRDPDAWRYEFAAIAAG
jgi:hypothetical protein